jgi:hypothetical protein
MTEIIGRKFEAENRPIFPLAHLIGFKIVEVGVGRAVIELEAGKKHTNPMGTLHGGVFNCRRYMQTISWIAGRIMGGW